MTAKTCPRCLESRTNVGPWRDPKNPQWPELCGSCKSQITITAPGFAGRMERAMNLPEGAVQVNHGSPALRDRTVH